MNDHVLHQTDFPLKRSREFKLVDSVSPSNTMHLEPVSDNLVKRFKEKSENHMTL